MKCELLSSNIHIDVSAVSLSVPEGKVTAITGQNGAGKTTLAQILCGLARQTRGHTLIDGKKARVAVQRREIYYCGNDTSTQFFTASVAEELLLNTRLTEENKGRARHLLKEFGLTSTGTRTRPPCPADKSNGLPSPAPSFPVAGY